MQHTLLTCYFPQETSAFAIIITVSAVEKQQEAMCKASDNRIALYHPNVTAAKGWDHKNNEAAFYSTTDAIGLNAVCFNNSKLTEKKLKVDFSRPTDFHLAAHWPVQYQIVFLAATTWMDML